jgi:hypothetical protein
MSLGSKYQSSIHTYLKSKLSRFSILEIASIAVLMSIAFNSFFYFKQNSFIEWSNVLYMIAMQKDYFGTHQTFTWFMNSGATGLGYPVYIFYGPGFFFLSALIPFGNLFSLNLLMTLFISFYGIGTGLICRAVQLRRSWTLLLMSFSMLNFWSIWMFYKNAQFLMTAATALAYLGIGVISNAFLSNRKMKLQLFFGGAILGSIIWIHTITFYLLLPFMLVVGALFVVAHARRCVESKVLALSNVKFSIFGFIFTSTPIALLHISLIRFTVSGNSEAIPLSADGLVTALLQPITNVEIFAPFVLLCAAVLILVKFMRNSTSVLLASIFTLVLLMFVILFRTNRYEKLWESLSFFTGKLQFPDRILNVVYFGTVLMLIYILRFLPPLTSSLRARIETIVVGVVIFSVSWGMAVSAKAVPTFSGYSGPPNVLGINNKGEVPESFGAASSISLVFRFTRFNTIETSDYDSLFFNQKSNTSFEVPELVRVGKYNTNINGTPFSKCVGARVLGNSSSTGFLVLEVSSPSIIKCKISNKLWERN